MTKHDLIIRHSQPNVYNVLHFEKWLNDYKCIGFRLLENERNQFIFKKSNKLDFTYFVLVSKCEFKMTLAPSPRRFVIDPNFVDNYLNKNNLKYNCILNDKGTYIYQLKEFKKSDLDTIKLYRYSSTLKLSRQENSICKVLALTYFIISISALFLSNIPAFVLCAVFSCVFVLKLCINMLKLNKLKASLNKNKST